MPGSTGGHDLVFLAPSYMFELARFGRPTEAARIRMAEMDAQAPTTRLAGADWLCPLFLLAEHDGRRIRVTALAHDDLAIDSADPFGAGKCPANRGCIRDLWQAESRTGGQLMHRWAYPAARPLHPGGWT